MGQAFRNYSRLAILTAFLVAFPATQAKADTDKSTDTAIRKAVDLYNQFSSAEVLVKLWKITASPKEMPYLNKLQARAHNVTLPHAYYHGDGLVYFEGVNRPLEVVNLAKMEFSYKHHSFNIVPGEYEKSITTTEHAFKSSPDISLMDLILPAANADDDTSTAFTIAAAGLAPAAESYLGLGNNAMLTGATGVLTAMLAYTEGRQVEKHRCEKQMAAVQQAYYPVAPLAIAQVTPPGSPNPYFSPAFTTYNAYK